MMLQKTRALCSPAMLCWPLFLPSAVRRDASSGRCDEIVTEWPRAGTGISNELTRLYLVQNHILAARSLCNVMKTSIGPRWAEAASCSCSCAASDAQRCQIPLTSCVCLNLHTCCSHHAPDPFSSRLASLPDTPRTKEVSTRSSSRPTATSQSRTTAQPS